jgi:uncharacterized MAPEG superfamily protein
MSGELRMLAYAVGLLIVLVVIQAFAGIRSKGLMPLANNRDDLGPAEGFHARMLRVVDNHREGLTMFAPLALIAAVMQISTPMTILASQLFLFSRIVHALLYILGVPLVRPLTWGVSMAGTIMMLLAVLGLI